MHSSPTDLPAYYTRLPPFAAEFGRGRAVLTYHKLGPRPPKVRLKGLYVSQRLFDLQLRELAASGVRAASVGDVTAANNTVAITFDDGFLNVLRYGLEPLRRHGFKAIQFLVADLVGRSNEWELAEGEAREQLMDRGQISEWLAAGHEVGAHSLTHPHLTRLGADPAREEIGGAKRKLEDLLGCEIRHFCYPYGDWNPAVRDLVAEAGYETACTTEPGINLPGDDLYAIRRFTARYRSRSWRSLLEVLGSRLSRRRRPESV